MLYLFIWFMCIANKHFKMEYQLRATLMCVSVIAPQSIWDSILINFSTMWVKINEWRKKKNVCLHTKSKFSLMRSWYYKRNNISNSEKLMLLQRFFAYALHGILKRMACVIWYMELLIISYLICFFFSLFSYIGFKRIVLVFCCVFVFILNFRVFQRNFGKKSYIRNHAIHHQHLCFKSTESAVDHASPSRTQFSLLISIWSQLVIEMRVSDGAHSQL